MLHCVYVYTDAVEEREGEQLQVDMATDETSPAERQEQEFSVGSQTTEEHSKLKNLISSTINEKLEQIQVHTLPLATLCEMSLLTYRPRWRQTCRNKRKSCRQELPAWSKQPWATLNNQTRTKRTSSHKHTPAVP